MEAHLDRMTRLLLDKELLTSKPTEAVQVIARAYTLTALRKLDGTRRGSLVRFLYDLGLLGRSIALDLTGATLSQADLTYARLSEARLGGSDLSGACLAGANLGGPRFMQPDWGAQT
jgi:uncharacterized protein YjbI with pentapeptide repeats